MPNVDVSKNTGLFRVQCGYLSACHSCESRNDSIQKILAFTTLNPEEPNIVLVDGYR
ncbi:hypothetical protein GF312_08240 [Candidatus Poribacteria bacterium]|nr:hypothetical protein [Candidatus Poribacteria bacterium]